MPAFPDRQHAGRELATHLREYADRDDVIVLGLPRGGVPVAYEVAQSLGVPLDVFVVRKLGTPGQEELAMGAVASGDVQVLNRHVIEALEISEQQIARAVAHEKEEVRRREHDYRGDRPPLQLRGKIAILVDDGLATGSTMRAAARAIRDHAPQEVVIAVPVSAERTCEELKAEADRVICALTPEPFYAVGMWYARFDQTSDDEVRRLLERADARQLK